MTSVQGTYGATPTGGATRARFWASGGFDAAGGWVLSFLLVLLLGADSGGFWPTAWGWTALTLLFLCAVVLIAKTDVRIRPLEAAFPAALLGLTLWGVLSAVWNSSLAQPLLESQRTLMYAAGVFAALLVVRSRSYGALLGGRGVH